MDRNTMIVRLVEALVSFACGVLVVLRLHRLWFRLRKLQLRVGEWFKVSMSFFPPDRRKSRTLLWSGDQLAVDCLIITHPDDDHQILIAPHHGRSQLR